MAELMRYAEMKDSGVEWLGEIPRHWGQVRLKVILSNSSVKNHPEAEVLSLYRELGVVPKKSRDDNHNVTSEDTSQYKFVEIGNLVINKMKAWQGSLAISEYEGIVSPAYYVCKLKPGLIHSKYLHYLLRSSTFAQRFECLSTGMRIGQWDLGIDDFLCECIFLPMLEEQQAIASYLDDQCVQIDDIIASAKASIEDYKQWKASVIYEAVTRGLNPDVKMKRTTNDYFEYIPDHWDIYKMKYLLDISSGDAIRNEEIFEDGKYPVFGGGEKIGYCNFYNTDKGNLIIGRVGARCGCVTKIYNKSFATDNALVVKTDIPEYIFYVLIASDLNKMNTSNAQPLITGGKIKNWKMPICPEKKEQEDIISYLNDKCSKIDDLITEKETLIADLESYKKSLIYEVVTGKRKVA